MAIGKSVDGPAIRDARGSILRILEILALTQLASERSCIEFYTVRPIVLSFRVETQGFSENIFREPCDAAVCRGGAELHRMLIKMVLVSHMYPPPH